MNFNLLLFHYFFNFIFLWVLAQVLQVQLTMLIIQFEWFKVCDAEHRVNPIRM